MLDLSRGTLRSFIEKWVGMQAIKPLSRLLHRLRESSLISDADAALVLALPTTIKTFESQADIVRQGDISTQCCFLMQGQLIRSRISIDSKRQITSFHVAGDLPDLHSLFLAKADHNITALGRGVVCFISHRMMHELLAQSPALARALWRETLVDASICREWEMSLGSRDGAARVAHLLCELTARLTAADLTRNLTFALPWSQLDLGDACGLSNVHVNRIIQTLRAQGVIDWRSKVMKIARWDELVRIAAFSPEYLHLPEVGKIYAGGAHGNGARVGMGS